MLHFQTTFFRFAILLRNNLELMSNELLVLLCFVPCAITNISIVFIPILYVFMEENNF